MDFDLTKEQEMIRREVRKFAQSEIAPVARELDEREAFSAVTRPRSLPPLLSIPRVVVFLARTTHKNPMMMSFRRPRLHPSPKVGCSQPTRAHRPLPPPRSTTFSVVAQTETPGAMSFSVPWEKMPVLAFRPSRP